MTDAVKIVEITARVLGVELIDIIDEEENVGNVMGTDGYIHILVSKNDQLEQYPQTTEMLYQVTFAKIQAGVFTPESDYEKSLEKNLKELGKVPSINILHQDEVDGYNVIVWDDELMVHNLARLKELEKQDER